MTNWGKAVRWCLFGPFPSLNVEGEAIPEIASQRPSRAGQLASEALKSNQRSAGKTVLTCHRIGDEQLKALWRQEKISAIFKRSSPLPVLARIPLAEGNMKWLRDGRRLKPKWCARFKAWEVPDRMVR